YRASDLAFELGADTKGISNGFLSTVTWSSDGQKLLAGGGYQAQGNNRQWRFPILMWDREGRRRKPVATFSLETIMHIIPCGTGFAVATADPAVALLGPDGAARLVKQGAVVDMTKKLGQAFQVSPDGSRVRFGLDTGEGRPVLFDLARATLDLGAGAHN